MALSSACFLLAQASITVCALVILSLPSVICFLASVFTQDKYPLNRWIRLWWGRCIFCGNSERGDGGKAESCDKPADFHSVPLLL